MFRKYLIFFCPQKLRKHLIFYQSFAYSLHFPTSNTMRNTMTSNFTFLLYSLSFPSLSTLTLCLSTSLSSSRCFYFPFFHWMNVRGILSSLQIKWILHKLTENIQIHNKTYHTTRTSYVHFFSHFVCAQTQTHTQSQPWVV